MTPREFLLHDLRHMVGTNNRAADFSYREFGEETRTARIALYTRFKRFAAKQAPMVEEIMHSIYAGLTHDVDPKLYTLARLKESLRFASRSTKFRQQIREEIAAELKPPKETLDKAVVDAFARSIDFRYRKVVGLLAIYSSLR